MSNNYCDMSTTPPVYRGNFYPSSTTCTGTMIPMNHQADGSCVTHGATSASYWCLEENAAAGSAATTIANDFVETYYLDGTCSGAGTGPYFTDYYTNGQCKWIEPTARATWFWGYLDTSIYQGKKFTTSTGAVVGCYSTSSEAECNARLTGAATQHVDTTTDLGDFCWEEAPLDVCVNVSPDETPFPQMSYTQTYGGTPLRSICQLTTWDPSPAECASFVAQVRSLETP